MAEAVRKNPRNIDPVFLCEWQLETKAYNKERNKWFWLVYVQLAAFIAIAMLAYFYSVK